MDTILLFLLFLLLADFSLLFGNSSLLTTESARELFIVTNYDNQATDGFEYNF